MSVPPPAYLLLDIGMVLVRLNYDPLAAAFRQLTGLDPGRMRSVLTSGGLVERFESGALTGPEFHEEVCRRLSTRISWDGFLEAWNSVIAEPLVSDEQIEQLTRKARLWAISNTNELHFDCLSRRCGFLRRFEGLVLSYQEGLLKPDARIFARALHRMGAQPAEVLFVDDQEANTRTAQALGIQAIVAGEPGRLMAGLRDLLSL